jgi:hypothetical protein
LCVGGNNAAALSKLIGRSPQARRALGPALGCLRHRDRVERPGRSDRILDVLAQRDASGAQRVGLGMTPLYDPEADQARQENARGPQVLLDVFLPAFLVDAARFVEITLSDGKITHHVESGARRPQVSARARGFAAFPGEPDRQTDIAPPTAIV